MTLNDQVALVFHEVNNKYSIPGFIEETVKEGIRKALSTIMESEGIGTSGNVVQPQAARMRTVQQVVVMQFFQQFEPMNSRRRLMNLNSF